MLWLVVLRATGTVLVLVAVSVSGVVQGLVGYGYILRGVEGRAVSSFVIEVT